jgi:hypothetical protein
LALESITWGEHDTMLAGICDLAAPSVVAEFEAPLPGALFMVLSSSRPSAAPSYGTLELAGDGSLLHNGDRITDIVALTKSCLAGRR